MSVKRKKDWENFRDKISKKRNDGKKNRGGSSGNLTVQRLSANVEGKCQKYSRIGPLTLVPLDPEKEVNLPNIKAACQVHFKTNLECDVLAAGYYRMEANKGANNGFTFNTSKTEESLLTEEPLDFSLPWHFSDVVLVVGDTKFHVHKCNLSMWSPVFKAMFLSQFLESNAKEILLPGKRADEVKELLKVIYSSWSKPKVTEENYQSLLQLADEYQMDRVKRLCSEFLVNKIKVSNCLDFFKLAEQFCLEDVMEKCFQEVCYNSSADLEGSEHFNGFEPEFKVDICMRVILELERTLEEYMLTCYDLVHMVYRKVSVKINGGLVGKSSNLDEHIRRHKENSKLKNVSAKAPMRKRSTLSLCAA